MSLCNPQPCSVGRYQDRVGQENCDRCSTGKYQDETGKESCKTCPLGKYQDRTERSSCDTCPDGRTSNSQFTGCNSCSTGSAGRNGFCNGKLSLRCGSTLVAIIPQLETDVSCCRLHRRHLSRPVWTIYLQTWVPVATTRLCAV